MLKLWIYNHINEEHCIPFVRVEPNIDEYVNRLVLEGTYKDGRGKTFIFGESGKAIWPEKSFNYRVRFDYIFADCDYIRLIDEMDE